MCNRDSSDIWRMMLKRKTFLYPSLTWVAWWCSDQHVGLVIESREFDSWPVHRQATTLGKLLTPMCLCHQAVQFGTGQRAVMLCGREGNRRFGVALAMRHRL